MLRLILGLLMMVIGGGSIRFRSFFKSTALHPWGRQTPPGAADQPLIIILGLLFAGLGLFVVAQEVVRMIKS